MQKITFVLIFILGLTSRAQAQLTASEKLKTPSPTTLELMALTERNYSPSTKKLSQASDQALELFRSIMAEENTTVSPKQIEGPNGRTYYGLGVDPAAESGLLGARVQHIKSLLNDVDIVYVPEVLLPGRTGAFFDPKGRFIGLDHDSIFYPERPSSPLVHETYHAYTYKQLLDGTEDLFAGLYRVTAGTFISPRNSSFYFRFGSIDEIVATALSAKLDAANLSQSFDQLTSAQRDDLLNEIYFSFQVIAVLGAQLGDLTETLLTATGEQKTIELSLGRQTKFITETTYRLNAYSREVLPQGGGTYVKIHPEGARWIMYSSVQNEVPAQLKARLSLLKLAAHAAVFRTEEALKCLSILIEYPDIKKSNLPCLYEKAPRIFKVLEDFKKAAFPVDIFNR